MKTILIIITLALASCGSNEMTKQEAEDIIRQSKQHYSSDSLLIEQQTQVEIAKEELRQATSK